MQYTAILILALCWTATQGARLRRGSQAGKMNPEAVAHTLVEVEDKWMQQATEFAGCNASDATYGSCKDGTMGEFVKSCTTVVRAIVEGSNGDKSDVKEYLNDICGQGELQGWKSDLCGNLTVALSNALTEDSYVNREELHLDTICGGFMTQGFMKKAVEQEKAREEQERQRAEEEAKARAEEEARAAAAAAKAAAAQAKADAAKNAAEEAAQKRAEAQAKAAEAQRKSAEAAEAEAHANATVAALANATTSNITASVSGNATDAKPESAAVNTSVPAGTANSSVETNATQSAPKPADKNVTLLLAKRAPAVNTSAPAPKKNVTLLLAKRAPAAKKVTVNTQPNATKTSSPAPKKNATKHE